jgi:Lipocalin-like domain
MIRTAICVFAACLLLSASNPAAAQTAKSIAGAYTPVSSTATDGSGKTSDIFGPNPRGMLILMADGRYSLTLMRSSLPKFAANSRAKGSAEENQAVVAGSINHFGRYTVEENGKLLVFHIDSSTYPNWDGTSQKRPLTIKGDELSYKVAIVSSGQGSGEVVWKRMKPAL